MSQQRGRVRSTITSVSLLSRSAYMSANSIYFAFGLAAGFALFGIVLGVIWKRL